RQHRWGTAPQAAAAQREPARWTRDERAEGSAWEPTTAGPEPRIAQQQQQQEGPEGLGERQPRQQHQQGADAEHSRSQRCDPGPPLTSPLQSPSRRTRRQQAIEDARSRPHIGGVSRGSPMLAAASARTRGGRAGGRGRGRSTREGGPENAFQMAARGALTEVLRSNEAEALSGSIYEAEEEEADSGSNASDEAQSQVPARQGGNSAHVRSATTNFNRTPTQAQPSPPSRTATNNPDTTANQPAQQNLPPPPPIAPRTAAR
ncbi:unnamed protein product, partial [Closterium sp. NIES-53]